MGSTTPTTLPYWQINVPPPLRTAECPPFLLNLNPKDLSIISTPDSLYQILTWPQVRHLISLNRIDYFQRIPSDLRRYLQYNYFLKQKYGSVMNFVLKERLGWEEDEAGGDGMGMEEGFKGEKNWKVLWNDWPYGIDTRIVHLVVWTKFELEDDEETGDVSDNARKIIDGFVDEKFGKVVGKENVIWFKNWKTLKSIHGVEHFHVMLFDPDPEFISEITHGDVPLSKKVQNQGPEE